MRLPTTIKLAGSFLALGIEVSGISSIPIAVMFGAFAVVSFVWGLWDLLADVIVIKKGARPNSKTTEKFDRNAKRVMLSLSGIGFLVIVVFVSGTLFYRSKMEAVKSDVKHVVGYGRVAVDKFAALVSTKHLMSYSDTHKLLLACRTPYREVDYWSDENWILVIPLK